MGKTTEVELRVYKETDIRIPRKKILTLFATVTKQENGTDKRCRVNLIFSDNRRLKSLNRIHRGQDNPTDVLSFNIDDLRESGGTFGEVYISVPIARKQASEYGGTISEEFLRLACHGFLHLFGYDHVDPRDEKRMKRREDEILEMVAST